MDCVSLEFHWPSPLRKAPRDTVFILVHQGCLPMVQCLYMRCSTDTYLLKLYLYFLFWMGNSNSLRWFLYHSDSLNWQISRCCWITSGSKNQFIFSAHFLWCFQEVCSLYTRTHVTFSKSPISNFRFLGASSLSSFFLPHIVHYWVNTCSWSYRNWTDFLLMQGEQSQNM